MENACKKPRTGLEAKAIRDDGKSIQGGYVPEGSGMIRITWDNNDFAVLELKNFVTMSSAMFNIMNKEIK